MFSLFYNSDGYEIMIMRTAILFWLHIF